jgi:DHA2 family multidrug resistance protein
MHQTVTQLGRGDVQTGAVALNQMIGQQAAQLGFNEVFHLLGWIFLGVIVFVWFAKPPFAAKAGGGAAAGGH